jgi:hypothetical protein
MSMSKNPTEKTLTNEAESNLNRKDTFTIYQLNTKHSSLGLAEKGSLDLSFIQSNNRF